MKALVTGGAGFIGSHLVDHLMQTGEEVRVLDNFASGSKENLAQWLDSPRFEAVEGDMLDPEAVKRSVEGCDTVFHLAANPEVRMKKASPGDHFRHNITATFNLLEATREAGCVKRLVFASSSTVYGEASVVPTAEDYGPLLPISLYGSSKLACEALISGYAAIYGFRAVIYRLANIVGPRSSHGVIYDFVKKLRADPQTLMVLGDGGQSKSYVYVMDCVEGFMAGLDTGERVAVYNLGTDSMTTVLEIAETVKKAAGCPDAVVRLTGGVDGGRGWRGDVKVMQLDTSRLRAAGWVPRFSSSEAVALTAKAVASSI